LMLPTCNGADKKIRTSDPIITNAFYTGYAAEYTGI